MDLHLGKFGIWTFDFERQPIAQVREEVAELEELGYGAIWIPEVAGREALSHAALLLAATSRIVIANGIARIGERTPRAMVMAQRAFAEAYPGRYLLGRASVACPMALQSRLRRCAHIWMRWIASPC